MGLTGFFLDRAFNNSLTVAEHSRLRAHINLLLSVADLRDTRAGKSQLNLPITLIEADFEQPNSGLYAYVYNDKGELVWNSNSASLFAKPDYDQLALKSKPGQMVIEPVSIDDKRFFVGNYQVLWEDARAQSHPFRFVVMHSGDAFDAELKAYRSELWRWLTTAGLFLLIAQALILRWGLRPLPQLARALKSMQAGDTSTIEGEHPKELQRIVNNLNQVLDREQALRQRYRNSLADLAHSLKTPLAVLQSKLSATNDPDHELEEQVTRMSQVVTYQLQRAVSSQQQGTFRRCQLEPIAQRLFATLQKVYYDKRMQQSLELSPNAWVGGDEQDVMEMVGNLLENAFKYGKSQVHMSSRIDGNHIEIDIEDDGPGVPPSHRDRIIKRGQRLDTSIPGQGIGLAVATEIVQSYNGQIAILDSALGGACFRLRLPLPQIEER